MAEVIRYIDPDVVAGDGSGDSWINAYSSASQWEAAEQTNLVTDGDWHHVYCRASAGTADTTICTINGWTTDATHYILIEAASTDRATPAGWDTDKYRLDLASGDGYYNLESYVRFDGLQCESADQTFNLYMSGVGASSEIRISNCRVRGGNYAIYVSLPSDSPVLNIWNCIVENCAADGVFYRTSAGTCNIYNTIAYNCTDDGIQQYSGTTSCYNVASFGNGDDFFGVTGTIDYCASDDGDGTHAVTPSGADWQNEFVNPATGNFTLVTGGNCEGGGTDNPSSGFYSTDMDGDSYTSPWSIGVDSTYISASGSPWFYFAQLQQMGD